MLVLFKQCLTSFSYKPYVAWIIIPLLKMRKTEAQRGKFICPNQLAGGRAVRPVFTALPPGNGVSD